VIELYECNGCESLAPIERLGYLYIIALIKQKVCLENFKPNPHTIGRWSRAYMTNIYFVRVCELLASLHKWHVLWHVLPIVCLQKTTIICLMPKGGNQCWELSKRLINQSLSDPCHLFTIWLA